MVERGVSRNGAIPVIRFLHFQLVVVLGLLLLAPTPLLAAMPLESLADPSGETPSSETSVESLAVPHSRSSTRWHAELERSYSPNFSPSSQSTSNYLDRCGSWILTPTPVHVWLCVWRE